MKKFAKLRTAVHEMGYTIADVAGNLGKSVGAINARFNGHQQWELDDMYSILEMLDIPLTELPIYFPPEGQNNRIKMRPNLTQAQEKILTAYDSRPEMQVAIDTLLGLRRITVLRDM